MEKLIPASIINALSGEDILLYGDGMQMRDWLYVDDHVEAIKLIAFSEIDNETFNIGTKNVLRNKEIVSSICRILNKLDIPKPKNIKDFAELIKYTNDRPGHDFRYAIDPSKILNTFEWKQKHTFQKSLEDTIKWYISNRTWWEK